MKVLIPLAATVLMISNPAAARQSENAIGRVVANYVAHLEAGLTHSGKADSFAGTSYQEASNRLNDPNYDPRDPDNAWGGQDDANGDHGGNGNGEGDHGGNGEGDSGGNGDGGQGGDD